MSKPVTVTVRLRIKPDKVDALLAALPDTSKVTRAHAGTVSADVLYDPARPTDLMFVDVFESAQAAEAYFAWREERGDLAWLGSMLTEPPTLETWPTKIGAEHD